jgi:hypothetical protein
MITRSQRPYIDHPDRSFETSAIEAIERSASELWNELAQLRSTSETSVFRKTQEKYAELREGISNSPRLATKAPVKSHADNEEGWCEKKSPKQEKQDRKEVNATTQQQTFPVPYGTMPMRRRNPTHTSSDLFHKTDFKRDDFKLGDVIYTPCHVPSTNDAAMEPDPAITASMVGPVYSKRRMMVVLFIHRFDLFCLPIYSFSGRGLASKQPEEIRADYVELINGDRANYKKQGPHDAIRVYAFNPVREPSVVQLTRGHTVEFCEVIQLKGRLNRGGYDRLLRMWDSVITAAKSEPFRPN